MAAYGTIYDDTNVEQMDALPITQMHRNVDLENVNADKEGAFIPHISTSTGNSSSHTTCKQVMSKVTPFSRLRYMDLRVAA
jgi:hypothetical protein